MLVHTNKILLHNTKRRNKKDEKVSKTHNHLISFSVLLNVIPETL